jgi:hypothetical protein
MWPFKKSKATPPNDVSYGEMTARYDTQLEDWGIEWEGLEFHVTGIPFNEAAFDWARDAAKVIDALRPEIVARVMTCLDGWPCDKTKAEILSVDLDDYGTERRMDIAFTGDDSWGDFGVNAIVTDGKIVDVYGGD